MPKVGFFVGAASTGVGGAAVLLAWDRRDRGPAAADDLDNSGIALYSWTVLTVGAQLIRMKALSPVAILEQSCPEFPDGAPYHDYVNRLEFKSPGTLGAIADFSLDIFDGSQKIYTAAPSSETVKFEVSGILSTTLVVQDRPTIQALEEPLQGLAGFINPVVPAKELWRELMTPNRPISFFNL